MAIGVFEGHAFVIKDIKKLAKTYACAHCNARFTQAGSLQRHAQRCAQGKTVIDCPGEKVEAPQTAFEKAFYPRHQASRESLRWLEQEAKRRKICIHHAMSGHGGERWIERAPVDGYNPETKTVFQYHGCYWHGCRKCCPNDRDRIIDRNEKTREDLFKATKRRTGYLRKAGYRVVEAWACEVGENFEEQPQTQTKSYPHAILYDFEAYGDNNQRKEPTTMFTIENVHVPISVSIGDTLEREPTHICERDPAEWRACKKLFREKGMRTFADWLRYYNNLDVAPGLEALQKMRNFYTEKGIDILKDAVSIPGVRLHYLLRGAVERKAELYSPGKEAYDMLKEAVVGGPSLVFTRHHEVGVTGIRSHQIAEPSLCKNILGYDANALYLSTMLREMPCGKERVVHYEDEYQTEAAPVLTHRLKEGSWFGFAEVDIEIPKPLHPKFEEMCPFFYNKVVPVEAVPEHMLKYLRAGEWSQY